MMREYVDWIGLDLAFQEIDAELDEIRLDTLPMMGDAQSLYASMGFHDIAPYYDTPVDGTRFMSKQL